MQPSSTRVFLNFAVSLNSCLINSEELSNHCCIKQCSWISCSCYLVKWINKQLTDCFEILWREGFYIFSVVVGWIVLHLHFLSGIFLIIFFWTDSEHLPTPAKPSLKMRLFQAGGAQRELLCSAFEGKEDKQDIKRLKRLYEEN